MGTIKRMGLYFDKGVTKVLQKSRAAKEQKDDEVQVKRKSRRPRKR